jgi:hypothetical protein
MTQRVAPFLEGKYGWDVGEAGWNTGVDENFLKFSYLFDRNVDGIVATLPSSVVNGQSYFLTTDNRLYFAVGTTWYSSPTPKWFIITIRTTGEMWQFDGSSLLKLDTNTELSEDVAQIELTLSSLGSAAFSDVSAFATPEQLDIQSSQLSQYTDTEIESLVQDFASSAGTTLVGRGGGTLEDSLDSLEAATSFFLPAVDGENITVKLTTALSSGQKRIKLPAGTFLFDNPINIEPGFRGFVLEGAGIYNTTLKATVTGQPSLVMARTGGSTASFYQSLRELTVDGDGKATYFRNASAYGSLDKVRSVNHVETNYHATGLINLHTGCIFPVNPNGVICTNATVWCSHNANYFQGCYIHGGGASGVAIRLNNDNGLESVKNSFHQCTIENGKIEVEDGAYAVSFDDNYLEQITIHATGNCNGLVITNNRGAEAQPFVHLDNVSRLASVKISDNNTSFDIYITVANREGSVDRVLDFYQFPEMIIEPNGRRQQPILINGLVPCDMLKVQRSKIPGDVSGARVEIIGIYAEMPAEATPTPVLVANLYLRAATSALDGYFIEERTYARRPGVSSGGVDPYRASYWLANGYAEYPGVSGGTTGVTSRTTLFERNPAALSITYSVAANGANSKKWEMYVTGEANRVQYLSTDLRLTQIS